MASEGRITDKLARYTSDGQLTCAICKITIKSNAAWGLHVTGSMHVEQLKKLTQMLQMQKAAQAQTSTPAPAPATSSVQPATTGLALGYDSDEDEEESVPSAPTPATAAPAATPATAASTEDSFEFLFEEEAPFVSDDEADWENIDVPDDWMGDPDEYTEAEVSRRKEARREQWTAQRAERREAARAALSGVEMVDEEGHVWRFDGAGWVRVGSVGGEWRGQVRSGFTAGDATVEGVGVKADEGNVTVIGDASLELAAFEKQLEEEAEKAQARLAEEERLREQRAVLAREKAKREREEAVGGLRARVREAKERAVAAEQELKERKRKREEEDGSEDDEDEEFDAEALVNWRGR